MAKLRDGCSFGCRGTVACDIMVRVEVRVSVHGYPHRIGASVLPVHSWYLTTLSAVRCTADTGLAQCAIVSQLGPGRQEGWGVPVGEDLFRQFCNIRS